ALHGAGLEPALRERAEQVEEDRGVPIPGVEQNLEEAGSAQAPPGLVLIVESIVATSSCSSPFTPRTSERQTVRRFPARRTRPRARSRGALAGASRLILNSTARTS